MKIKVTISILLTLLCGSIVLAETKNTRQLVLDAFERAKALEGDIGVPSPSDPAAKAAAHAVANHVKSDVFRQRIDSEKERIKSEVFKNFAKLPETDDRGKKEQSAIAKLPADQRFYILISSSIPPITLRKYVSEIDALNDPNYIIVLRGFVDGMKKASPTLEYIKGLLKKDPDCQMAPTNSCALYGTQIHIDPLVFRKFQIEQVPAFIFVKNVHLGDTEGSIGNDHNLASEPVPTVIYGDSTLSYVLDEMYTITGQVALKAASDKLKEGFYNKISE